MKSKLLLIFFVVLLIFSCYSQNLVNNPGFETVTAEPYWGCELTNATGWLNPSGGTCPSNNSGTPDLFSTLSTGQAVIPNTFMGYTTAHNGNRITGIVTYHQQLAQYREYMMTQLSCPLIPGVPYTVTFWSTGANPEEYIYHSNNVGIYFHTAPLVQSGYNLITGVTPQINVSTIIADVTWTQYSFQFTPTQAFTYMTIGNFKNDANTLTQNFGQNRPYAYYFFDDISVSVSTTAYSLGNDTTYCEPFSRTLSTGFPGTSWSTGATAAQITVTTPGTYWAQITDGCTVVRDTIVLTQNPAASVNLGNDTALCNGQTINLSAAQPNYTYHWQDNSTNATYNVTSAGTYAVTVTNASGCTASDNIIVTYTSGPPSVNLGNDTAYCGAFSRTLSTGNTSTIWSTGVTASQITVNTAGTYWAQLSNSCGVSRDTIVLTQNPAASVSLGNDTALCNGQTLNLSATQPNYTYHWQDNSTNATYNVTSAGTYAVTVTNASGCTASDNIIVTYTGGPPAVNLDNDTAYCGIFSQTLSTGNASTLWSTGVTASQITVTTAGIYWAQLSNGCGATRDTIVLTQNPTPSVFLGNDTTLCTGQSLLLDATQPNYSYQWHDNSTASTYSVTIAGTYAVTVTNATNCTASDNISVAYTSAPPAINLGNDTTYCGPFSATLYAGQSAVWSTGITANQINVNASGVFWAQASNSCGTTRDSVTITQNIPPAVNLPNDTAICDGNTVQITATTTATNLLWNTGASTTGISASAGNTYWVDVWNLAGCTARDSIIVAKDIAPTIDLGPDTIVCGTEGIVLYAPSGASSYLWQDNSTDSIYHAQLTGTYTLTVSTACGSSTASVKVNILYDECELHMPTAFSPNSDGVNDIYRGVSRCGAQRYHLQIYNRWGNLIFETTDVAQGWNGIYKSVPQPTDVYIYQVEYFNYCQQKQLKLAGNFTLLR